MPWTCLLHEINKHCCSRSVFCELPDLQIILQMCKTVGLSYSCLNVVRLCCTILYFPMPPKFRNVQPPAGPYNCWMRRPLQIEITHLEKRIWRMSSRKSSQQVKELWCKPSLPVWDYLAYWALPDEESFPTALLVLCLQWFGTFSLNFHTGPCCNEIFGKPSDLEGPCHYPEASLDSRRMVLGPCLMWCFWWPLHRRSACVQETSCRRAVSGWRWRTWSLGLQRCWKNGEQLWQ